ncbi:MAG: cyclic pyranopterin monophosphate synthase MoaC [Thermoplasmata archaeon]
MGGMVDIQDKTSTSRGAISEGFLLLRDGTLEAVRAGRTKKGDPVKTSEVAAIQAVKDTPRLIPFCHPIPLTNVAVELEVLDDRVRCECRVKAHYKTGVEMESLVGVTVALLTFWDMVKYLEKDQAGQYPHTRIEGIRVISKVK